MNGVHDMGGMEGLGTLEIEKDEPVFHADWERRVFALNIATKWLMGPVDRGRHATERLDPAFYLSATYYQKWLAAVELNSLELGVLSQDEIDTGEAQSELELPRPAPEAEMMEGIIRGGMPSARDTGRLEPRFAVGDKVRTINNQPHGHTRLPRYARGRVGTINILQGTHLFPDTAAHDQGENPHPLYNVRFEGTELWGDSSTGTDCVYIDLWEDYLQPCSEDAA